MSQDHDRDAEKSDLEKEISNPESLEEAEERVQEEHEDIVRLPRRPKKARTRHSASHSDDKHDEDHRGRRQSSISTTSSQHTCSDHDDDDDNIEVHDHQVAHSVSRGHSSVRSVRRDAIKVPRSSRRGLLARFCFIDEVTNSYDFARSMKWIITAIVALAGAAAPMGSAIVLPALVDITHHFHSTATVVNLSVAFYMLSMSIFPLWWSSFSETLGRRTIYVVSFAMFLVFNILSAISTSIGMFIVMRILSGGAAASVQAVGAGTIADIWEVKERGKAMGMFYLGPLCGPLLAPIIGGVLAEELGWRATQWFVAIFGGVLWVFIVFCLPETLPNRRSLTAEAEQEVREEEAVTDEKGIPKSQGSTVRPTKTLTHTTTKQSVKLRSKKYLLVLRRVILDPLHIILYLQFPAVAILVALASITFGSLYVLSISIQQNFSAPPYNYSSIIVGCLYIPNSIGYFLASIFGGRWVDHIMHREARKAGRYDEKGRLQFIPEDRMQENGWLGVILYPCSLIAYGWFARFHINVAAALVANFFFGIGSMLIFALVTTMLTEFMPRKASNGIALNNFIRNIFSCVGTIVTNPLINAIGNGWLFLGLGVIGLTGGSLTLWSMKRFGPRWRKTMDLKIDKFMGE